MLLVKYRDIDLVILNINVLLTRASCVTVWKLFRDLANIGLDLPELAKYVNISKMHFSEIKVKYYPIIPKYYCFRNIPKLSSS